MTGKGSVRIRIGQDREVIVLLREEATPTVVQLRASLPFESTANRWGDEVYFDAPFHLDLEKDAQQDMEVGDVAYWPDGDAIAIFFGPTPVSKGEKPRAYGPCNMVGRLSEVEVPLAKTKTGEIVRVDLA